MSVVTISQYFYEIYYSSSINNIMISLLSILSIVLVIRTTQVTSLSSSAKLVSGNRAAFLKHMTRSASSAVLLSTVMTTTCNSEAMVLAKEVDPTVKGTKNDPKYEGCVSNCLFECTKPKGDEQKSRAECLPGCKKECATSKQQLMIGTPKGVVN